jgi:hypothetical protein
VDAEADARIEFAADDEDQMWEWLMHLQAAAADAAHEEDDAECGNLGEDVERSEPPSVAVGARVGEAEPERVGHSRVMEKRGWSQTPEAELDAVDMDAKALDALDGEVSSTEYLSDG